VTARLAGKIAIITAAAQGIGRAIAGCFGAEGAAVAVTDVQEEKGRAVVQSLAERGVTAIFEQANVADQASVDRMVLRVVERLGSPDVLVNNAGIAVFSDPLKVTAEDWQRCFSVDLDGVWNGCRAVLPHMLVKGKGDIINIASVHSFKIIPHCFPYPIAKHAVVGLTRALALDVRIASRNFVTGCLIDNVTAHALLPFPSSADLVAKPDQQASLPP
jgi:NAD(P)-dependent dehydrogenase (short-subunit alcohol dehydrogenase family)